MRAENKGRGGSGVCNQSIILESLNWKEKNQKGNSPVSSGYQPNYFTEKENINPPPYEVTD